MTIDLTALLTAPRLLIEADLKPILGSRFQPTGFPHLGAAEFRDPDGITTVLVESPQSVANHLERTVFKEFTRDTVSVHLADPVIGLPYVEIDLGDFGKTNTLLESHRLNTPYLWESKNRNAVEFQNILLGELGMPTKRKKKGDQQGADAASEDGNEVAGVIDMKRFYRALLKYDPNCLLHGVFLEKVAGRLRLPRALSGFIEAKNASTVDSGGVKNDHVFPKKDEAAGITSKDGYTNVPFPRTEYVAKPITAYFNMDLALIRGYGLEEDVFSLLAALGLYKIRRFIEQGLRLRTACDLALADDAGLRATAPKNFNVPELADIEQALPGLLRKVADKGLFAEPRVTRITWEKKMGKTVIELPRDTNEPKLTDDLKNTVKWIKQSKKQPPKLEISGALDAGVVEALIGMFPDNQEAADAIRKKGPEPIAVESGGEEGEDLP